MKLNHLQIRIAKGDPSSSYCACVRRAFNNFALYLVAEKNPKTLIVHAL